MDQGAPRAEQLAFGVVMLDFGGESFGHKPAVCPKGVKIGSKRGTTKSHQPFVNPGKSGRKARYLQKKFAQIATYWRNYPRIRMFEDIVRRSGMPP
jgi:hypothetical protein